MEIGKYSDGRAVTYDEATGAFAVGEGNRVSAQDVARWDASGQVAWASTQLRDWFHSTFAAANPAPDAPAHKKSKVPLFLGIGALVMLFACGGCVALGSLVSKSDSGTTSTSASTSSNTEQPAEASGSTGAQPPAAETPAEPQLKKIGQPLKVGDLVFTVNSAASTKTLKSPLGNKSGDFLVVTLTIKNESKEAVMINMSFFKLIGPDGAEYETDEDSLMYVDAQKNFFLKNINPNLSKQGTVIFSVPAGLSGVKLQVQTGAFGTETGQISLTK